LLCFTPNLRPCSSSVIFGIITPGVSTKYAKGSSHILIPATFLVVQGLAVDFAIAFLLFNFGVVYLN